MSHARLRKENNCLNCDAVVDGPYCKNCGQLNAEPKQTLWHLLTHFIEDVTHFDGKFFDTMKSLLIRPGFLSSEYLKGRRTKYLDPVRMYLFVSAMFFLLMFSMAEHKQKITANSDPLTVHLTDSMINEPGQSGNIGYYQHTIQGKDLQILYVNEEMKHGHAYYDSTQKALRPDQRDGLIEHYVYRHLVNAWQVYKNDPYNFFDEVNERFEHSFSKIFFISMPLFALLLFLLNIRRREQYYYVSHLIFALHYFTISFLFLALMQIATSDYINETWTYVIDVISICSFFIYLYIAMMKFYGQGWFKTLIKFILLSVSAIIMIAVITTGLFLNSFLSMVQ
ncbi:MAG: hypothetical protein BGO70_12670 [Bacteroidetes bacterium 43-93]|nr:DUF3667 domain-containing protein [Bacteroidota bacterium]OJW99299.1 MAG: hypothetical protein BGO70_12670 [Bacteroidetes bacterium 43-93]